MKRLIIYILCVAMFFQNGIVTYAEEAYEINNENHETQFEEGSADEEEQQEYEEAPIDDKEGQQEYEEALLDDEEGQQENEEVPIYEEQQENEEILVDEEEEQQKKKEDQIVEEEEQQEEQKEDKEQLTDEDPQYGRENGFLNDDFFGIQIYSNEYTHADRFSDYDIKDVIDVSKYQGIIDWSRVKQSGIDYAIIRAGFRGYGQTGTLNIDDRFHDNMRGAIAAGLKVGVYFFSQAITEDEAVEEAEYVLGLIEDYTISLPVAIDFEYASTSEGLTGRLYEADLSREDATNICKSFCEVVESSKYSSMIYANKSMLENDLDAEELSKDYNIWLANYGNVTFYEGKYDFWQYTQTGSVAGIDGNVDKSFWYKRADKVYANIKEGVYTISSALDTKKLVNIPNATSANGVNIEIQSQNEKWEQKFYIRPETDDGYIIMSMCSGKVLETDGNKIYQTAYTGREAQLWKFVLSDDGNYVIESVTSKNVMDIANGKTTDGNRIVLYKFKNVTWQKFHLNVENVEQLYNVKNGIYSIETALSTDKVISINEEADSVLLDTIDNGDEYKFCIEQLENGRYRILSVASSKYVTAGNDKGVFFAETSQESLEQEWFIKDNGDNTYTFISVKDGKCLDIPNSNLTNGTALIKYSGNGKTNQRFRLYKTQIGDEVLEEGIYVIHSALSDKMVLDIYGRSKASEANLELYTSSSGDWQKFVVKRINNGNYSIYAYHSGMAITVKDSQNVNCANVYQYYPTGGVFQEWKIIPTGKGYYKIVSALGDKVLDVEGGKANNKANLIIYNQNNKNNQKFRFEKVAEINEFEQNEIQLENGTYTICSSLSENKVLDVEKGSLYAGANVILYSSNNASNQQYVLKKDVFTGLYTITSKKSGMKLTYKNGLLKNGTNVYQESTIVNSGQQWKVKHIINDYYMIYAGDSAFCLDVTGRKTTNGTNIEIYNCNRGKAQIFKLKKINNSTNTEQDISITIEEGLYTISSGVDSKMVLDVASASTAEGANILLYNKNEKNNQKFIVQPLENGKYTITALCSDKLLTADGNNVCQKSVQESGEQEWKLIYAGNGYYTVKNAKSNKVMDLTGGKAVNKTNVGIYNHNNVAWQRFKFIPTTTTPEAKLVSNSNSSYSLSYNVYTKGNESSADNKYYLMLADSYAGKIYGSPLTSITKNFAVSINISISDRAKLKEIAMNKLVLAVKQSNGTYKAVTNPVSISNPEAIAKNTTAIFKASSKKGLQGVAYASNGSMPVDARYANTKQTLLNLDIADVVNPKSNYTNFTYKGKTYKFSKCTDLVANVKSMNAGYQQYLYGNNGTTKVAVSLCLLLSYDSANSFLIDPAARSSGHRYYTLNVREEKGRETLEALFVYLGELFGQEDCYVTNWILGNEINSSKAWNYQGSLSFDNYMTCYATAFRMLYNAVKSEKTGNTVSISLDNGWTAAPDTYAGKTILDSFAKKINALNPNIEWSISYHPYSYPLTRADFWNDSSNTTNSTSTKYISMKNITVLTNYAASLEKTYKMDTGSIRVLLTEQGYSYGAGAEKQAQAIARGYYIAEFNNRIDAFIIRAIVDDAEEAKGKLYFGLMNSQQDKRIAFYVYEFMDSDLSKLKNTAASSVVTSPNYSKFNSAKNILCNTNWESIVPGFNAAELAGIK